MEYYCPLFFSDDKADYGTTVGQDMFDRADTDDDDEDEDR
jgi:hypothetical protein